MTLSVLQDLPILASVVSPNASSSSFHRVEVIEHISLLPCYAGRLSHGIIEHLNAKVFHFSSQLGGTVLSYSKPLVLQRHGAILDEQPHLHFDLNYSVCLFKPLVGSVMSGVVNNIGREHVGCLVHSCFNASVLAPSSAEQNSSWFTEGFDIGSTVWFKVVSVDHMGGIVSITGEYWDINTMRCQDQVGAAECRDDGAATGSSKSLKKSKHKAKHSDTEISAFERDDRGVVQLNSSSKKKRKRQSDSEGAMVMPKRTKIADDVTKTDKQKKKRSKHKL